MGKLPEDLTAYWSAISQVIPVLALAIVLEARALARRWTNKRRTPSRRFRSWSVLGLFVLGVGLINVELTALGNLATGSYRFYEVVLSQVVVLCALFLVVSQPVALITGAALSDSGLPKWRVRRLRKEMSQLGRENLVSACILASNQLEVARLRYQLAVAVEKHFAEDPHNGIPAHLQREIDRVESAEFDKSFRSLRGRIDRVWANLARMEGLLSKSGSEKQKRKRLREMRKLLAEMSN